MAIELCSDLIAHLQPLRLSHLPDDEGEADLEWIDPDGFAMVYHRAGRYVAAWYVYDEVANVAVVATHSYQFLKAAIKKASTSWG